MGLPRVIVTSFVAGQSERIRSWHQHSARVLGGDPPPHVGSAAVGSVWHLASSNNRTLARRIAVFPSADAAVADARRTLGTSDTLEASMVRDRHLLELGWYLRSAEGPTLVSARWYSTERDRRNSVLAALEALRSAVLDPVVRVSAHRSPARSARD